MPNGISRNRLSLILAVLAKHARLRLHAVDCHTNVVGGLQVCPAPPLLPALALHGQASEKATLRAAVLATHACMHACCKTPTTAAVLAGLCPHNK
jgi:predicted ATP-dependent serine protease